MLYKLFTAHAALFFFQFYYPDSGKEYYVNPPIGTISYNIIRIELTIQARTGVPELKEFQAEFCEEVETTTQPVTTSVPGGTHPSHQTTTTTLPTTTKGQLII